MARAVAPITLRFILGWLKVSRPIWGVKLFEYFRPGKRQNVIDRSVRRPAHQTKSPPRQNRRSGPWIVFFLGLHSCSLECCEYAPVSEWNPAETNASRIVDRVGDRRNRGFACRLAGSIVRKIRPPRIGISVHQHDVDPGRRVGVRERGM